MKKSAKVFFLPFIKKQQLTRDVFSFYFDRTSEDFDFTPGQYIRMTLPHPQADDRGTTRYFTIASSPLEKEYLMVTTKMIQSTFKETLHNLKKGESVQFFGPMGWFLLPNDEPFDKVFIAGGVGITPFHSLLHTMHKQPLSASITLIALFSASKDIIFYDALTKIAQENPMITVIYIQERFSQAVLRQYIKDINTAVYYVVGSPGMVAGTKALLLDLGIREEKIQLEDFTGY